jgi:hypothetical protein
MSVQEKFIKTIIKQKINIDDPETYEKLVDVIYKFAMLLMYGDEKLKMVAIDTVFQIIPEDVAIEIVKRYVEKLKMRYDKIKNMIMGMGIVEMRGGGKGIEDMFINFILDMYRQQMAGTVPSSQGAAGTVPETIKIKELPPELKKILEE